MTSKKNSLIINSLVPAPLAGNSVVLKPSPQIPLVGERIAEFFFTRQVFPRTCCRFGCIDTLLQIVQIPDIKLVTFIGSVQGGRLLRESTASRFLPLNLEFGGNDPAYVRPNANLKYKLGDPSDKATNVCPVISRAAKKAVNAQIEEALAKGAVNATPANLTFTNPPAEGNCVVPTILTNVNHDMVVMREETFGPVLPIMKVESDEEAVKWMNDSDYGLTASVWTQDMAADEKLFKQLEAGTVFINRCDYPNIDLAWTGWKNSGMGHSLGPRGFDAFSKLKSYHMREKQG